MKIILASSNQGKIKEFQELLPQQYEIINYDIVVKSFEIEENGDSFAKNALIKAQAVYEAIKKEKPEILKNSCILSDDSGISVSALNNEPGIFSARYSADIQTNVTQKSNREKLKNKLNELNINHSLAFYTAAIVLLHQNFGCFCTHGFMHGMVINQERGNNGFGYDFMFIPKDFTQTIGELDPQIKAQISHRSKAIKNILPILQMIKKNQYNF